MHKYMLTCIDAYIHTCIRSYIRTYMHRVDPLSGRYHWRNKFILYKKGVHYSKILNAYICINL